MQCTRLSWIFFAVIDTKSFATGQRIMRDYLLSYKVSPYKLARRREQVKKWIFPLSPAKKTSFRVGERLRMLAICLGWRTCEGERRHETSINSKSRLNRVSGQGGCGTKDFVCAKRNYLITSVVRVITFHSPCDGSLKNYLQVADLILQTAATWNNELLLSTKS